VGEAAERPTTWATAIRIVEPAHAEEVGRLVVSGRLQIVTLSEDEIAHWWRRLSVDEGVFCEPASAAGVAALAGVDRSGWQSAVGIVTGHGLKDTGAVDQSSSATVDASVEAILEVLA
jgi:threonine synthase